LPCAWWIALRFPAQAPESLESSADAEVLREMVRLKLFIGPLSACFKTFL
jgi:hypothetical protein